MQRTTTVAVLAFDKSRVLLVKHGEAAHHLTGVYGLPGGRLDEGESLEDGAAREFQEETGLIPEKSSMIKIPKVYEAEIPRKGGLTFGLANAGPVTVEIEMGARFMHIQFSEVSGGGNMYRGQWQGGRVTTTKKEKQV